MMFKTTKIEMRRFPLIPLPNKEATQKFGKTFGIETLLFPLIPLPNKEATIGLLYPQ